MAKVTITEALADIKTVNARLDKRREAVMRYFARDARLRDPLEADGGSVEFVKRERQAIADLEARIVAIRTAIQNVNLTTKLTVGNKTQTVSEWLNWRREVSTKAKGFLDQMAATIVNARNQANKNSGRVQDSESTAKPGDIVIAVSEKQLSEEIEGMAQLLGELDGKLSLINATCTIEI